MFADRFRVDPDRFRLEDRDPAYTGGLAEEAARDVLSRDLAELAALQDRFYAWDRYALLLVLQAPDAGGKDSTIKHVMTGLNPAGCEVHSFKPPSAEELRHDFLWRAVRRLPERGRIGIFNRSYYEEVLIVRVRPELLAAQRLPPRPRPGGKKFWKKRFKDIVHFEDHLAHNGTVVVKFFLHLSKAEQKQRFLKRIEDPAKNWKLQPADYEERRLWDRYQEAYQDMLRQTSTPRAPWYVIPADHKWFTHLAVANILVRTLRDLRPTYPAVPEQQRAELERVRGLLEKED